MQDIMPIEQYANDAASTLSAGIDSDDTTLSVASATGFPTSGQFRALLSNTDGDREIVLVTAVSGTTFTITRGVEGSTAAAWLTGDAVTQIVTAASLQAVATNPIGSEDTRGQGAYLMVCHQSPDQQAYLMGSADGLDFGLLQQSPIFVVTEARDPSILRFNDVYYVAFTDGSGDAFTIKSSPDLKTWTTEATVDMSSISTVSSVWAPDWFVDDDGSVYIFVTCATGNVTTNFQIYEVHPSVAGVLSAWSAPTAITGTSLPANTIDAHMVKVGSTYNLWYKEETNHYVEYMSSSSLLTGYTVTESGDWASWGSGLEAPALVKVDSDTWRIYLNENDAFDSVAVYYSESTDDWATWSTKAKITSPWVIAHPGILRVRDFPTLRNMYALSATKRPGGATVSRATDQNISNSTHTSVIWTSEDQDDIAAADIVAHSTRLTAPSTGWYSVSAHLHLDNPTSGARVVHFLKNGATDLYKFQFGAVNDIGAAATLYLNVADYLEVSFWQNNGGVIHVNSGEFSMVRLA